MKYKRKWGKISKFFCKDLIKEMNNIFAYSIILTYSAYRHRKHIHMIWGLMKDYEDFHEKYKEKLLGKHLTGDETIFKLLYFTKRKLYQKYYCKIPEKIAIGKALSIALSYIRRNYAK
jgi:hypothetical protein